MLVAILLLVLLAVLTFMVLKRRYVGRLTSLATLLAAIIVLLVLIDGGFVPGMPEGR